MAKKKAVKKAPAKKSLPKKVAVTKAAKKNPTKRGVKKLAAAKQHTAGKPAVKKRAPAKTQSAAAEAPVTLLGNYGFKIDDWLPRFPLESEYGHFSGEIVISPKDVCNNEQLRREMQDQFKWGPAVPVDIFIMAEGEPDIRSVTKLGGLPYRPAAAAWPKTSVGEPMLFLGQFNFSDSKDLTGVLPGEILLVFADGLNPLGSLHFEWQPSGLKDLIAPGEAPKHPDAFDPCYGHIFRTNSFPKAKEIKSSDYPQCRGKDVRSAYHLRQYQATQIGEAPFFIQKHKPLPGRLLCTISSTNPSQYIPYPWINRPKPLMPPEQFSFDDNGLMFDDTGCVYISLDKRGKCHWDEQCF